jgi:hypothetical protein
MDGAAGHAERDDTWEGFRPGATGHTALPERPRAAEPEKEDMWTCEGPDQSEYWFDP